jgi:hypothetical protein
MAYYLGRDVRVYLTTESTEAQVDVSSNAVTINTELGGAVDVAATGSITFLLALSVGNSVTIENTAGTSKTYTVASSIDVTEREFAASTAGEARDTLVLCINASDGHNGTITASAGNSGSSTGLVSLTQAVAGADGNTTITRSGWGNASGTLSQWTGGIDEADFVAGQTFAENLDLSPALTRLGDLVGVDLSIGVTDEDVSYMGKRTVLKAEIKKETTVTLTRKKSNNVWDVVYNGPTATNKGWTGSTQETGQYGARWGVIEGAADTWYINNGLISPKNVTDFGGTGISFGYRVFIQLTGSNGNAEIIAIPGCQLTGHTISLNADGTTEETCELISHVTPKIGATLAAVDDRLLAADM